MTEHEFVRTLHQRIRNIQQPNPRPYIWKIDANAANGVPDAWYSGNKGSVWVEYKFQNKARYKLSKLQEDWLRRRNMEGQQTWVVVGTMDGVFVFKRPPYPDKLPKDIQPITAHEYINLLVDTVGGSS